MQKNRDITISRTLSHLLRHGGLKEGIPIQPNGFVDVKYLLQHRQLQAKQVTFLDIERVVAENDKARFTLTKCNDGSYKIKANQGHSLTEVTELNLERLNAIDHPVVHGTYYRFWHNNIKNEGLKKMKRNHIHFACTDKINFGDKVVISGFRRDAQVLIYIDTVQAVNDGIVFYKSENNVILSEGINGVLPLKYFRKVVDRKSAKEITM